LLEPGTSVWLKGLEQYRNGDKHKENDLHPEAEQ
jgi:hypothetical protein